MEDIKKLEWEKFWAFKFSLLGASILGEYYPTRMEKQMGKCFKNAIIVSRKGHNACYLVKEQRKEFGKQQIKIHVKDGNITEFSKIFREETDKLFDLTKSLKDKQITGQEFLDFISKVEEYTGYYTIPRQVIDFIDESMVEKIIEGLKETRLYVEPAFGLIEEVIQKFVNQINEKTGYDKEHLTCMTVYDVKEYISKGNLPEKKRT